MADLHRFAAQVLEASASGYASAAAHHLVLQRPILTERYGAAALQSWKSFMTQALSELATAVRFNRPGLFVTGVRWLQSTFAAQGSALEDLTAALESLDATLMNELPEMAREPVALCMHAGLTTLTSAPTLAASHLDRDESCSRLALRYITACLEGRLDAASATILEEARRTLSDPEIYLRVLLPAQQEVGRMWQQGDIRVAEEHIVSETTLKLTALLSAGRPPRAIDKTVLTAAVDGNLHGIGIRAVSDFFFQAGWRCIPLGANAPASALAEAAAAFKPDLAALSVTLVTQLPALQESIEALRAVDRELKVLVGGNALDSTPGLWQEMGADGYAVSPDAAVRKAAELVGVQA